MIFPPSELERLRESIDEVGILVPLTVYQTPEDSYRLIDGERRLKCALELGLETVPCYVVEGVDDTQELEWMFSIHMMKEDWAQGPIALAVKKLAERLGGWQIDKLRAVTGLSLQQLGFYRALAEAPAEILDRVIRGELPANLVADSVLRVATPLRNELPDVAAETSEQDVVRLMVEKRDAGNLPDVVSLRQLRTMIRVAAQDRDSEEESTELREVIAKVIGDPEASIEEAYEDTVGTRVATQAFQKSIDRFAKSAVHAARDARRDPGQAAALADQLESLVKRIEQLVEQLRAADGGE